ncbi:hypothetical protein BDZ97DRAFT_2077410 [Flammula alnicola]|nr:hypothetical protein BDZ97DRAFT_2077410 [Flammula alnicola]
MAYRHVPAKLPPPKPDHSFARPPNTKLALFFWKRKMWIEATFGLTVYEPWEKVVVLSIFAVLFTAILIVMVNYLPQQLIVMQRRAVYYLWGVEQGEKALWPYFALARPDGGMDAKESV